MTNRQKILVAKLIKGYSLAGYVVKGEKYYRVLDEKLNPVEVIRARIIDTIDKYINPKFKIWKRDKYRRKTLNLSVIRQLHGRNTLKRMYKMRDQLDITQVTHKQKGKRITTNKKTENEKVLYLF